MSQGVGTSSRASLSSHFKRVKDAIVQFGPEEGRDEVLGRLNEIDATLVEDDLSDTGRLTRALDGADAVIHSAGSYRIVAATKRVRPE